MLAIDSIPRNEIVRRERVRAFSDRLQFCLRIRDVDAPTSSALETKIIHNTEALNVNVMSGALPSHEVAISALDGLVATARDIEALPLKN
jgi:hypothetical protein